MGRPPCCDKTNVKRGLWTPEEDAKILAYVSAHGTGNWTLVPKKAGLNRCGKSCRLRWTNYLRPDLKHESFTPAEEQLIIDFHKAIGSRWSMIARQLPGRTDNDVKNYWNTKLRKKLAKLGIDPVTHKPIPQVMSDYGNISRVPPNSTSLLVRQSVGSVPSSSPPVLSGVPYADHIMRNEIPSPDLDFMPEQDGRDFYPGIAAAWNKLMDKYQEDIDQQGLHPQHLPGEATSSSSSSSSTQHLNPSMLGYFRPSQVYESPCPPFPPTSLLPDSPPPPSGVLQNRESSFRPEIFGPPGLLENRPDKLNSTFGSGSDGTTAANASDLSDQTNHWYEASSPGTSFVDSILSRDSQIRREYPELLEGLFDY